MDRKGWKLSIPGKDMLKVPEILYNQTSFFSNLILEKRLKSVWISLGLEK